MSPTRHPKQSPLEQLAAAAQDLDGAQTQLLCEMAAALSQDVDTWTNPNSDLVGDGFGESLLNRLRLHHATSEEKFNKTSFEFAFKAAARFAGRKADRTPTHTFQGADVVVDGVRWSLKTEGAIKMSQTATTISKFSEARWIRDCLDEADFARETTTRLGRHLAEYDRVVTLRGAYVPLPGAMGDQSKGVKYDLVEIPHEMLKAVTLLGPRDFSPRRPVGSSSAEVFYRGRRAFTVFLDGSVEKVTLRNIRLSLCFQHASWIVPVLPQDD